MALILSRPMRTEERNQKQAESVKELTAHSLWSFFFDTGAREKVPSVQPPENASLL